MEQKLSFHERHMRAMQSAREPCMQECAESERRDHCYSYCMEWHSVGWLLSQSRATIPQVTFFPRDLKYGDEFK